MRVRLLALELPISRVEARLVHIALLTAERVERTGAGDPHLLTLLGNCRHGLRRRHLPVEVSSGKRACAGADATEDALLVCGEPAEGPTDPRHAGPRVAQGALLCGAKLPGGACQLSLTREVGRRRLQRASVSRLKRAGLLSADTLLGVAHRPADLLGLTRAAVAARTDELICDLGQQLLAQRPRAEIADPVDHHIGVGVHVPLDPLHRRLTGLGQERRGQIDPGRGGAAGQITRALLQARTGRVDTRQRAGPVEVTLCGRQC